MGTNYNIKLMVEFYSNAVAYGDVEKGRGDADVFTFLAVELWTIITFTVIIKGFTPTSQ